MQTEAVYQTLFWIGAIGVGVMGTLSAGAHGHGGHDTGGGAHHGHGHHGHDAGYPAHDAGHHHGHHHDAGHHTQGHHGHGGTHNPAETAANNIATVLTVLSPMTLFSVSLGAGATGLLLGSRFPVAATALFALLGGLALLMLIVRPLLALIQRFVSKPATTLKGLIAGEATAQNRFDASGHGIVNVVIDGQAVRLLAHLEADDIQKGVSVAPGDALVITQINEATNTCRVTKI